MNKYFFFDNAMSLVEYNDTYFSEEDKEIFSMLKEQRIDFKNLKRKLHDLKINVNKSTKFDQYIRLINEDNDTELINNMFYNTSFFENCILSTLQANKNLANDIPKLFDLLIAEDFDCNMCAEKNLLAILKLSEFDEELAIKMFSDYLIKVTAYRNIDFEILLYIVNIESKKKENKNKTKTYAMINALLEDYIMNPIIIKLPE